MTRICLICVFLIGSLYGAALRGVVKDPSGAAVPGAAIELKEVGKTSTNDQGRFEFSSVPPGKHQLVTQKTGFSIDERSVEASDTDVVIELKIEKQEISVDVGGKVSGMANSDPVYRALRAAEPTGSYKVSNFVLQRDVGTFTFEAGQF